MRRIDNIVIHCTAGHSSADKVQDYFLRPVSKGGRGWKTGGYHRIIEKDGTIVKMYDFDRVTNGVSGFNANTIHISYVGGVEEGNVTKAKDTRTEAQKCAIHKAIKEALDWMEANGQSTLKGIGVVGHRDFSTDKNKNGAIESWERIKECPSFHAIIDYSYLFASEDRRFKLPGQK